jgi:hypothetical protein
MPVTLVPPTSTPWAPRFATSSTPLLETSQVERDVLLELAFPVLRRLRARGALTLWPYQHRAAGTPAARLALAAVTGAGARRSGSKEWHEKRARKKLTYGAVQSNRRPWHTSLTFSCLFVQLRNR